MDTKKYITVSLPKLGESIVGATIVQWLRKEGELVKVDDPLVEVSTDKVNSEIPSPTAGIVREILAPEGSEVEVGSLLVRIEQDTDQQEINIEPVMRQPLPYDCQLSQGREEVFSPAVLRLARQEGIDFDSLRQIKGSGEGGRITRQDLEQLIKQRTMVSSDETEERIQLSGMRKAIAENMVRSFYAAPHASVVTEADVTETMQLIAREKERFAQTHGVKLTITSFLIQALSKTLQQFTLLNASLDNETIVMKRYINVGLAVHVEKGLLVPVIKNCQERNLVSIAKAVGDLSARARSNKLTPDEMQSGTVTLTNFGMTGALIGVPIIRYPEVAIIGAGSIQKRVIVREDDSLAIRQMMYVTLTFDHRVVDGVYGCEFLAALKANLESISLI